MKIEEKGLPSLEIDLASTRSAWRRTAKGRLRLELAGLAFALKKGFTPGDWARHLWNKGALPWMGKSHPSAGGYLLREARALRQLYPDVAFTIVEAKEERAGLLFTEGCPGGWGQERWALARGLGLTKEEVCAYCQEAFSVWAGQLGLKASMSHEEKETCRLLVVKP